MPERHEIEKELLSNFPDFFDGSEAGAAKLKIFADIAEFLAGSSRCIEAMKALDRQMQQNCGVHLESMLDYYSKLYGHYKAIVTQKSKSYAKLQKSAKYSNTKKQELEALQKGFKEHQNRPKKPDVMKHTLTQVLAKIETESGFSDVKANGQVDLLLGFQDSDAFRKRITLGRHFKDPTVPGFHGEHAHRIQWSLIALAGVVKDVPKAYAACGEVILAKDKDRGLWDAVCDRDGGEASFVPFKADKALKPVNKDFRSPELLTQFLIDEKNADMFPLLHIYVAARVNKRQARDYSTGYKMKEYAKLKAFGDAELDEEQKKQLIEYLDVQKSIPVEDLV